MSLWSSITDLLRLRPDRTAWAVAVAAVVLANGPLLQRASTVVSQDIHSLVPIAATLSPQIPVGYTGTAIGITQPKRMTAEFAAVMSQYNTRAPMRGSFEGDCRGNYSMTVRAAALAMGNCATSSVPVNYTVCTASPTIVIEGDRNCSTPANFTRSCLSGLSQNETMRAGRDGCPLGVSLDGEWPAFTVDLHWSGFGMPPANQWNDISYQPDTTSWSWDAINMTIGRAETNSCVGAYTSRTCTLKSAIAEYDVQLRNGTVTFASPPANPRLVAVAAQMDRDYHPRDLTVGGLALAAREAFAADVALNFTWPGGYELSLNTYATGYVDSGNLSTCQRTWRDPTDDIMAALNEIAFRISLRAGQTDPARLQLDPGQSITQVVNASQVATITVFQTVYAPLWIAVSPINLGVIFVFATFLGWWVLGRDLSLDPVETARAFQAPMFRDEPSDAHLDALIRDGGSCHSLRAALESERATVDQTTDCLWNIGACFETVDE